MKKDLIVFAEDWGALPSSTQHLIKHLPNTQKILWINSIGLRQPRLSVDDILRVIKKVIRTFFSTGNVTNKQNETQRHISQCTFLSIPAPKTRLARLVSRALITYQLKRKLKKLAIKEAIVWTSLPTVNDIVRDFEDFPFVYYCGDDFSALAGVDHVTVKSHEASMIKNADMILAASERLVSKFPAHKTKLLSHGVDYEIFTKETHIAQDMPNNGCPTAGFYGSISEWLNVDLLLKVVIACPNWNFVFVGAEHINTSKLRECSNCYFLGPKHHKDLPKYSQHWQVSLLPFKNNSQIRACNPLKLKEYLAAGAPIISTDFPALEPYKSEIYTISTDKEFINTLNTLQHNLPNALSVASRKRRRKLVRKASWKRKAMQLEQWMSAL